MREVLLASFVVLVALADSGIIEPKLRMVDRSPNQFNRRMPAVATPMSRPHQPASGDFDADLNEAISFSVNTRGEFGGTRLPLFCNCRVLSVLVDDDSESENPRQAIHRRSYTAPELRQKVPLVTQANIGESEQISFGVNVRGEDGPELNPTWCTCDILQRENAGGQQAEEDDDDEEHPNPHGAVRGGSSMPTRPITRPMRPTTQHIQLAEGSTTQTAAPSTVSEAVESKEDVDEDIEPIAVIPPSPRQVAESTVNLQLETGSQTSTQHRSWRTGVVVTPVVTAHSQAETAPEPDQTEYYFHGHRYSSTGQLLDTPKSPVDSIEMFTELDEGSNSTSNSNSTHATNDNITASDVTTETGDFDKEEEVPAPSADPSPSTSASPSPSPSMSPSASPEPDEDSENEDVVAVIQSLARHHPHSSALLSSVLQAAAHQHEEDVSAMKKAIEAKDELIRQLVSEEDQLKKALDLEMKLVDQLEATASPSVSPMPSPSPSPSPSESPSASSTPSPSPTPLPSPHHAHRHHRPRVNKKACYNNCRDTNCSPLFEVSLRQYAACMDNCAAACYN